MQTLPPTKTVFFFFMTLSIAISYGFTNKAIKRKTKGYFYVNV